MMPLDEYRIRQDEMLRQSAAIGHTLPNEYRSWILSLLAGDRHAGLRRRRTAAGFARWRRKAGF